MPDDHKDRHNDNYNSGPQSKSATNGNPRFLGSLGGAPVTSAKHY